MKHYVKLDRKVLQQLRWVYERATPAERLAGLEWYGKANRYAGDLARRYSVTLEQAAGVIAALSPGLTWELNVVQAEELISAWRCKEPLPLVGVYGRKNVEKCGKILRGVNPLDLLAEATGPKTRAFYLCIVDPLERMAVCIDRHAASAAFNKRGVNGGSAVERISPALYRWIAWHYRTLAGAVGLLPCQVQAIIWTSWRQSTPGHEVEVL